MMSIQQPLRFNDLYYVSEHVVGKLLNCFSQTKNESVLESFEYMPHIVYSIKAN